MRVFISADMEGISGVATAEDITKGESEYGRGAELMVRDINAAIEGAIKGGASDILVNDSHWTMRNIDPESLHDSASLIRGRTKPRSQVQGLTDKHDAAFFVGYHAKAGTEGALLNHTFFSNALVSLSVNGVEVGEIGCSARYAHSMGVPVGLITGDDKTISEARAEVDDVETVSVKEGIDRFSAQCLPVTEARQHIRQKAAKAVERAKNDKFNQPDFSEPTTIDASWSTTNQARFATRFKGIERIDGRTTRVQADEFPVAYEYFVSMIRAAAAGQNEHFG